MKGHDSSNSLGVSCTITLQCYVLDTLLPSEYYASTTCHLFTMDNPQVYKHLLVVLLGTLE